MCAKSPVNNEKLCIKGEKLHKFKKNIKKVLTSQNGYDIIVKHSKLRKKFEQHSHLEN